MKSAHEGDTLVVWKLNRLARSARQLIDTVDALRERGAAFRSLTDALDTRPRGDAWSSTYSSAVEAMLADPNLRVAAIAPRALRAQVRDPLVPPHGGDRFTVVGRPHRRPRPVCYAARVPYPASTGRQLYQVCGKSRGKRASSVSAGNRSESLPLGVSDPSRPRAVVSLSTRRPSAPASR